MKVDDILEKYHLRELVWALIWQAEQNGQKLCVGKKALQESAKQFRHFWMQEYNPTTEVFTMTALKVDEKPKECPNTKLSDALKALDFGAKNPEWPDSEELLGGE